MTRYFAITLFVVGTLLQTQSVMGQVNTQAQTVSHGKKKISFRQAEWKTLHLEDATKAETATATLKRIGCEVMQSQHDDHVDLKFRCITWKTLSFDTDQQVNQWVTWLVGNGLDTVVRNPPADTKLPTVKYRLTEPVAAHLHDREEAARVIEILNMLGCEVKTSEHNGHLDVNVQCPEWITLGVTTEEVAHEWQAWLDSNGFETQHTHIQN